jgi:hypothetical protein
MLNIPKDFHYCFEYLGLGPPGIFYIDNRAITVYLQRFKLQLTLPFEYDLESHLRRYIETINAEDYKGYWVLLRVPAVR